MRRSVLVRARSSSLRTFSTTPQQLTGARQPPSSSPVQLDSTPSSFHPKPHLRPEALQGVLRYSSSPITSSSALSASTSSLPSASAPYSTRSTVPPTNPNSTPNNTVSDSLIHPPAPVSPKLPPRRRPNYQAAGFGLSGDYGRRSPTASASSSGPSGTSRRGRAGSKGKDEVPVSPELPLQPGERVVREQQGERPSSSAAAEGDSSSSQSLSTATGGSVNFAPSNTSSTSTSFAGKNALGGEVLNVRGTEMRRMDEGEKEAVDGNEAEACYVPPPSTLTYHHPHPLPLTYSPHPLPSYTIAYETWGKLNADKSNAILLHTGLSASSHVASGGNGVDEDVKGRKGWWEDFVGSGKAIDTDRFYVICTNTIGGCFGSTGPSSQWPHGEEGERWATRFPTLSLFDMVRAQLDLLDSLGIDQLYASIGSSMGGMQSLALAYLDPARVGRVASISATGRSGLGGVGMRFAQRSVLMSDPNWNRGFYYDGVPPHAGMKLARQIATITYRSGPEWEQRFGRKMLSETTDEQGNKVIGVPSLSPDFLIETYLDHQGERFCLTYDANSMIYLSKAMDLFDMTDDTLAALSDKFKSAYPDDPSPFPHPTLDVNPELGETIASSSVIGPISSQTEKHKKKYAAPFIPTSKSPHLASLAKGLARLAKIPTLVLGVQSDVLFPVEQQRELADALKLAGNEKVSYYELGGVWGHDTFLLDVQGVGNAIRGFLH